jgi:hypothetical protein
MVPYALYVDLSIPLATELPTRAAVAPKTNPVAPTRVFRDVISELALARKAAASRPLTPSPRLQIVAFNDTNDLLTRHRPPWYGAGATDGQTGVEFVNVFVRTHRN